MGLNIFQFSGETGVRQTVYAMQRLINQAVMDPNIRAQAATAVMPMRGDRKGQAQALLAWTRSHINYVSDPAGNEMLSAPAFIAKAIAEGRTVYGDCDELSMYLGALLKSVGFSPSIRAVGYNGRAFSHVYIMCDGAKLDPTRREWLETGLTPFEETSCIEMVA